MATNIRDALRNKHASERAELAEIKGQPAFLTHKVLTAAEQVAHAALISAYHGGQALVAAYADDRTACADDIETAIDMMGGRSARLAISGDSPSLSNDDIVGLFTDLDDRVLVVELGDEAPLTFARFMQAVDEKRSAVIFVCDSIENHLYRCKPLCNKAVHIDTNVRMSN